MCSEPGPQNVVASRPSAAIVNAYSWSPIASLYLRPNLQYVVHPGGTPAHPNAFVFGLKSAISF